VVLPQFAEAATGDTVPFVLDLGGAAEIADSVDDFVDRLRLGAQVDPTPSEDLAPASFEILDTWAGNADGGAGARVAQAVLAEIGAA
jgi:hypothetical protein